ncbi:potassium voltage-gated channel subfamily A member 1-like [Clytia hemisphaerica]|uniref:Uncharacterized protein n=1 Tax=Clytia hemisphaerica TaxID=252671 RepID=A0A7M5TVS7_9CNID
MEITKFSVLWTEVDRNRAAQRPSLSMFIANDTSTPSTHVRRRGSVQSINSDTDSRGVYDQKQYKRRRRRTWERGETENSLKRNPNNAPRIRINVRGRKYETYIDTLDRFPDTLLGNKELRNQYYNERKEEIVLGRNYEVFEAVLFYYQSNGILARPAWVSEKDFEKELKFYQLQPSESEKLRKEKEAQKQAAKTLASERRPAYQKLIWNLMEHPRSSTPAFTCAILSIFTIIISVVVICLETMSSITDDPDKKRGYINRKVLFYLETTVMIWFTMEYLLRIISAPRTFKFILSPTGIIDLVVILPYYINIIIGEEIRSFNLAVFRIVRMFRVFRIFKLTRYSTGLKVLGRTILESFGQLVALFLCLFLSAILFSSCLFFIEHDSLDHNSEVFISIPDTFWYVIITMTSVGYGDVVPRTLIGRVVAAFCMVTGIIVLLCLPTPVFVTHFGRFYEDVISRPATEQEEDDELTDSEIWRNGEHNLMIPRWVNDDAWKEKIRTDVNQNLTLPGLNVYLSTSNLFLSRACSQEVLHSIHNSPSK